MVIGQADQKIVYIKLSHEGEQIEICNSFVAFLFLEKGKRKNYEIWMRRCIAPFSGSVLPGFFGRASGGKGR